jgi:hypothetical protein
LTGDFLPERKEGLMIYGVRAEVCAMEEGRVADPDQARSWWGAAGGG